MSELAFRPVKRRRRVTLNLTSLIDVLFLLLIFFMLTSTFRQAGELQLELPDSSTSEPSTDAEQMRPTEIALRADGQVLIDGSVVEEEELVAELRRRKESDPDARVILNAEAAARHADVVNLIDVVRSLGFAGLSLGTEMRPGASAPQEANR
ncbi:MAG TPA: biopolymer transporter ExbD [Candidatus Krumholzibacteria bacterium]|nr:biopolymer transporter ExbD [Candidatus Krumholzibacteria bacterium]